MIERIEKNDLVLRRYKQKDAEDLLLAIKKSYDELSPWMNWLTLDYDLKSAQAFINLQINNWNDGLEYTYSIRNTSGDFLGTIGLHLYDKQNDVASIGYWMNTQFTCKGFCTQAVKAVVENSLVQLDLIRIEIVVAIENKASQQVAVKAGAQYEALLKNRIRLHEKAIDAQMNAFYRV